MGLVSYLSEASNIREDGLRLFITILAGYPLAALYRTFLYNKPAQVQHIIFVIIGIWLYLFNYGEFLKIFAESVNHDFDEVNDRIHI